jgi:hypothetical protein
MPIHDVLVNDYVLYFYLLQKRYYKNSLDQKSGWNRDVIEWCRQEAQRLNLKEQDFWGGLVFDEMKIQVRNVY